MWIFGKVERVVGLAARRDDDGMKAFEAGVMANRAAEACTEGLDARFPGVRRWRAQAAGIEGDVRGGSLCVGSAAVFAEDVLRQPPGVPGVWGGILSVPSSSGWDGALKTCAAGSASPVSPAPCAVPSTLDDVYLGKTALPRVFWHPPIAGGCPGIRLCGRSLWFVS